MSLYFDKALSVNPYYSTALYNKGAALSKLGIYNESIAYFDKVLAIQPTNALALAGKKLDLAAFSKTKLIAKPSESSIKRVWLLPPEPYNSTILSHKHIY